MRTRHFGATAVALFLSIVGSWAQAPAPGRFQSLSSRLKIVVIEGKDAANVIATRSAVQPVVEVRDGDERPVAGANVLFAVPRGKGGFGAGDVLQLTVTTTDDGRAAATTLVPLAKGPMSIWVAATYQSLRTGRTIPQINFKTAAEAVKAGKGGGTAVAGGLKIAILEGEDGVNIVQNKTAVQPVVEVKDRNNLPVAGAVVTFAIIAGKAGFGGGKGASKVAVTTDANGRAAVKDLQPAGTGAIQIAVEASFAGQTTKTSMAQENFQTVKDAQKAGKKPGSSATDPEAESESAAGGDGSQADANSGQNNGQNGGGGGGRDASGGGGGGFRNLAAILGAVGAGAGAAAAQQANRGPNCTSQDNAVDAAVNNQSRICSSSGFSSQQCLNAASQSLNAIGAMCQCYGPDFPASDRQAIQQLIQSYRSLGFDVSSLSNCAR